MATCEECLHYEACVLNEAYWVKHNAGQACHAFKDKSQYVEQKHGRWVDVYGGKYDNPRYACSECQEKALYTFEVDSLGHEIAVQELSDHCPECGVKMDGES